MKFLAWTALSLGLASILLSVLIVVTSPRAMLQVRALDLPLTGLGEGVIAMLLPILLSTPGALLGVVTVRRGLGRVAMVVVGFSWLLLWAILGVQGFHHLF